MSGCSAFLFTVAALDAQAVFIEPVDESAEQIMLRLAGIDIHCCPHCGKGQMIVMLKIPQFIMEM